MFQILQNFDHNYVIMFIYVFGVFLYPQYPQL